MSYHSDMQLFMKRNAGTPSHSTATMHLRSACIPLFLLLLLLHGCSGKNNGEGSGGASSLSKIPNVADVESVSPREGKIPLFTWKDSTGAITTIDAYLGEVTLVNFWATWCGPCKAELPDLLAIHKELAPRNIRVIGISTDRGMDVSEKVSTFVREHGIPFQIVIANDDLESAFGNVRMLPTSFVVDRNGKIVETLVGMRTKEAFAQSLTAALKY